MVLFPAPFGPAIPTTSPASKLSVIPARATTGFGGIRDL